MLDLSNRIYARNWEKMKLIDMHCDSLYQMMKERSISLQQNRLCVDLEKLKKAHSMAQFFACFIYKAEFSEENIWDEAYQYALDMIDYGKTCIQQCDGGIATAYSYEDIVNFYEKNQISAMFTLEEGGVLNGKIERLDELYQKGIRLITLTWNYENCIGYPNSRDENLMQLGLKPFGLEVVRRMNELGMLIDVSHLSDGGFWDVVKYSSKPVVASHSNTRVLCNHPRNLSDKMIKALAEKGGVCGLNFYPYFSNSSGKATAQDIAEHAFHMYQVGGEDVIAIGTDFDGFDEGELDITDMSQMDVVYEAFLKRGFTERQMDKIWHKNILRVIKEQG